MSKKNEPRKAKPMDKKAMKSTKGGAVDAFHTGPSTRMGPIYMSDPPSDNTLSK